jgi:hypothetical protein
MNHFLHLTDFEKNRTHRENGRQRSTAFGAAAKFLDPTPKLSSVGAQAPAIYEFRAFQECNGVRVMEARRAV